jgi:hypothetical protein
MDLQELQHLEIIRVVVEVVQVKQDRDLLHQDPVVLVDLEEDYPLLSIIQ